MLAFYLDASWNRRYLAVQKLPDGISDAQIADLFDLEESEVRAFREFAKGATTMRVLLQSHVAWLPTPYEMLMRRIVMSERTLEEEVAHLVIECLRRMLEERLDSVIVDTVDFQVEFLRMLDAHFPRDSVILNEDEQVFREFLDCAIEALPEKQAVVVRGRFGIGKPKMSVRAIAMQLQLSTNRVYVLEHLAIRSLRLMACRRLEDSNMTARSLKDENRRLRTRIKELEDAYAALRDMKIQEGVPVPSERVYDVRLDSGIDELELSVHSAECLRRADIKYIGELVQKNETELLGNKKFSKKCLKEIKEVLAEMGLSLGMKLDGWTPKQ